MSNVQLTLPTTLVSPIDLNRCVRELKNLDDYFVQASVRQPGTPLSLPRSSLVLDDLAKSNDINLLDANSRKSLVGVLESIKQDSKLLHISFAADPSQNFLSKLVDYLRREIHPQILIRVGLQPSIAAGCVVRTPIHYYDFSMRRHLQAERQILTAKIKEFTDESGK